MDIKYLHLNAMIKRQFENDKVKGHASVAGFRFSDRNDEEVMWIFNAPFDRVHAIIRRKDRPLQKRTKVATRIDN